MNWRRQLLRKAHREERLDAELRYHFDCQVADRVRTGMSEEEAGRADRLEFGGLDQVKEDGRDARGTLWVDQIQHHERRGWCTKATAPATFSTTAM